MKYTGLGITVLLVLALAGCGNKQKTQVATQDQTLLKQEQKHFAHVSLHKASGSVRVLMPQTKDGKNYVQLAPYAKLAKKMVRHPQKQTAYVTFTAAKAQDQYDFIQPTVRVYETHDGKTKLLSTTQLTGLNINRRTAAPLRIAELAHTAQQLSGLNYHALAQAVAHRNYSPTQLRQARALHFLKNDQATNFRLTADSFTVFPDKNALGIKQVRMPLSEVRGYLSKSTQVASTKDKKLVALTFDDGPNPKTTPEILKILRKEKVKATFFMLGKSIAMDQSIARAVVAGGHEVGTHTYDHKNLSLMNPAAALQEVTTAADDMYAATGVLPTLLRPPYGAVNMTHDNRIPLPSIQWSVDSEDWRVHAPAPIIARVTATARPGSIILMHDIHPQTVAALPAVIKSLKAKGYHFATVTELLGGSLLPQEQYFGVGDHRSI
jgi:peptidoglycan/xylan/chitin deacetylase (PgdA/CDA1 family)